jgi:hypothetical protein
LGRDLTLDRERRQQLVYKMVCEGIKQNIPNKTVYLEVAKYIGISAAYLKKIYYDSADEYGKEILSNIKMLREEKYKVFVESMTEYINNKNKDTYNEYFRLIEEGGLDREKVNKKLEIDRIFHSSLSDYEITTNIYDLYTSDYENLTEEHETTTNINGATITEYMDTPDNIIKDNTSEETNDTAEVSTIEEDTTQELLTNSEDIIYVQIKMLTSLLSDCVSVVQAIDLSSVAKADSLKAEINDLHAKLKESNDNNEAILKTLQLIQK